MQDHSRRSGAWGARWPLSARERVRYAVPVDDRRELTGAVGAGRGQRLTRAYALGEYRELRVEKGRVGSARHGLLRCLGEKGPRGRRGAARPRRRDGARQATSRGRSRPRVGGALFDVLFGGPADWEPVLRSVFRAARGTHPAQPDPRAGAPPHRHRRRAAVGDALAPDRLGRQAPHRQRLDLRGDRRRRDPQRPLSPLPCRILVVAPEGARRRGSLRPPPPHARHRPARSRLARISRRYEGPDDLPGGRHRRAPARGAPGHETRPASTTTATPG